MKVTDHTYLFTITDLFSIDRRGIVIAPGIPWAHEEPVVRKGDPLILRTPLGDIIRTSLKEFEMIRYLPGGRRNEATPIMLEKGLHRFDLPIGMEVYLDSSADVVKDSSSSGNPG